MTNGHLDSGETIARLRAAQAAPSMPSREAENCARLLERLTRPVRVGVFGLSNGGDDWLLGQILSNDVLPQGAEWPTLEVVYGAELLTHATHEDGLTETFKGAATSAILDAAPVFIRIEAPFETLKRMSFLYLATDDSLDEQVAALDWAEPRTDIAIWATLGYGDDEQRIWGQAPDRLKNHALLVATGLGADGLDSLQRRAGYDFDGVYVVPRSGNFRGPLLSLMSQLENDIDDARMADIDAAQMFLHRLGYLLPTQKDEGRPDGTTSNVVQMEEPVALRVSATPGTAAAMHDAGFSEAPVAEFTPAPAPEPVNEIADPDPEIAVASSVAVTDRVEMSAELRASLSEPFLYLKRRARALLELIEWRAAEEEIEDDEGWPEEVLSHCCETTEGLQSRAMDWPDDEASALTLRRTLDEACDVAILLQVEGGKDQAQDAAMMLLQLRGDFERELAA